MVRAGAALQAVRCMIQAVLCKCLPRLCCSQLRFYSTLSVYTLVDRFGFSRAALSGSGHTSILQNTMAWVQRMESFGWSSGMKQIRIILVKFIRPLPRARCSH
jgi:hypothetical protein